MRVLNISLITKLNRFDALHIHTFSLAKSLSVLGNKLLVIVGGNENKDSIYDNLKISILRFKPFFGKENFITILYYFFFNNINLLIRTIKKSNYDVIYERHSPGLFVGLILSKIKKVPLIYEVNGIVDEELFIDFGIKNQLFKRIISKILSIQLNNSHGIIVQTKELKKIMEKKFGIKNIFVVPNGTEIRNISMKRNPAKTLITYVGVLDEHHNLEDVFQEASSMDENFSFYIIGNGTMRKKYEEEYKDDKRFVFLGELNHKKALEIIKKSDICIASYGLQFPLFKKYGFYFCPLKILEYISFGKPTILYGLSNSFIEELESEEAIRVVHSKKQFAAVLKGLIKDRKGRIIMGESAERILHRFTWREAGIKTERILKDAIKINKK